METTEETNKTAKGKYEIFHKLDKIVYDGKKELSEEDALYINEAYKFLDKSAKELALFGGDYEDLSDDLLKILATENNSIDLPQHKEEQSELTLKAIMKLKKIQYGLEDLTRNPAKFYIEGDVMGHMKFCTSLYEFYERESRK